MASTAHTNDAVLVDGAADFAKLQSVFGQMRALGGSVAMAWTVHGVVVAVLATGIAFLWHGKADFSTKAAALATGTMLASPYVYLYDLVAIAVPLALLSRSGFSNRETATVAVVGALMLWGPDGHVPTGLIGMVLVLGLVVARILQHRQEAGRALESR